MAHFVPWYNIFEVIFVQYERIRNLREDSDMTQQQIADKLYISRRAYSNYETGVRGIPTEILSQIADIYGTSVDYLIGRTNVKKPYPKKINRLTFYRKVKRLFFYFSTAFIGGMYEVMSSFILMTSRRAAFAKSFSSQPSSFL